MDKFYKRSVGLALAMLLAASTAFAQTQISGTVKDGDTGEVMPGVNIVIKGSIAGTITNSNGEFNLKPTQVPPFTLVFSFIGYVNQEIEITEPTTTGLNIVMASAVNQLTEIVVSGGLKPENYMKAYNTVEMVDRLKIQQSATADYFDVLANEKGVQVSQGSLNFTQVNTRGFATIANTRFVQLVDGMDTSAPLLNFPTGNIVGIGELDAESMELIPGASSALWGPNAFNGILLMTSKSPFDYQGFSAQFKGGVTNSDARGSNPMTNYGFRYAKAWNNKFAFKINFSILSATDWLGNDYKTDRLHPESKVNLSGNANFDGLNLYGDETPIPVPIGGTFGTLDLRRTGFKEQDILDNSDAKSIKFDGALHYKISQNMELLYNYRFGGGSSVYQGTEKYALRDFTQQFHKVELKGSNYFVRAYMTETRDGDSWNMSALGGYANEYLSPTATVWAPTYAQRYVLAMQGYIPGVPAGDPAAAHAEARRYADNVDGDNPNVPQRPIPGTSAYKQLIDSTRTNLFQAKKYPGASFIDNSRLYHAQFNYQFPQITFAEVMVGGNFRQYSLFSNGTVFNEDPDGDGTFKRVKINEGGAYVQIAKQMGELKLTGSVRYDKNQNFDGRFTPRLSAVYTFLEKHNIRASFQTGFRNPDTQAQFIYFPSSGGILLGSTKANAERYGVHNGGAWTQSSYLAYRASGGSLDPVTGAPSGGDPTLLKTANVKYVKPERLQSVELGYKGELMKGMVVDFNTYYTIYNDFIGGEIVAVKEGTKHQGKDVPAGTLYSPYVNKAEKVTSTGVGLGVSYKLIRNFALDGSYSWAKYDSDTKAGSSFRAGFNTPSNKFSIGLSNRKIFKNFGFNVNYRWQEGFLWESSYGTWNVPEFGVMDAQISYKITSIKTIAKVGGTNILGGDYRTNLGAPFVGQQFYISLTFDPLNK